MPLLDDIEKRMPYLINRREQRQFLLSCQRVSDCLMSSDARKRGLEKLENAMVKEIEDKLPVIKPLTIEQKEKLAKEFQERKTARYYQDKDSELGKPLRDEYRHLLHKVLTREEQNIGLNPGKTYLGVIKPDTFRQEIRSGTTWKDPTLFGRHGEFAHRIQWYIVATAQLQLSTTLANFYCQIGEHKHTAIPAEDSGKWQDLGLWDALVDRNDYDGPGINGPYNTESKEDFRSPENLTHYILNHPQKYPLLNAFIDGRQKKRDRLRTDQVIRLDYIARKVYGISYNLLSYTDKKIIDELGQGSQGKGIILTPGSEHKQKDDTLWQYVLGLVATIASLLDS